jgi:DNA polymerase-4
MKPILEVTENKSDPLTATFVAKTIRQQIRDELHLTASDWRKPDGLFVIQPSEVNAFLPSLPIGDVGLSNFAEAAHADLSLFH